MLDIEKRLSKKQSLCMSKLCQTLHNAGFPCYLVGGAVRDLLLQKEVKDLDFTTNAKPEEVSGIFPKSIPTGLEHGTITVRLEGESFEVTTYRSEGKYTDARHPDKISYASSLSEDLKRRDFTINALAYEPLKGELVDEHGGLIDLERKYIRAIGKAEERFYEDALRPVRACRFAASLDFEIEEKTYRALSDPKIRKRAAQIAIERFSEELEKGFAAKKVSRMLASLEKSALLPVFVPLEQARPHSPPGLLKALDQIYPAPTSLRMAYWRYALGFHKTELLREWSEHLRLSRRRQRDILFYCRYFIFQEELCKRAKEKKIEKIPLEREGEGDLELLYFVRKFLSQIKEVYGNVEGSRFIRYAYEASKQLGFENPFPLPRLLKIYQTEPLVIGDLRIKGTDLMAWGYEGAAIGKALRQALEQVLRKPESNKKEELRTLLDNN